MHCFEKQNKKEKQRVNLCFKAQEGSNYLAQ